MGIDSIDGSLGKNKRPPSPDEHSKRRKHRSSKNYKKLNIDRNCEGVVGHVVCGRKKDKGIKSEKTNKVLNMDGIEGHVSGGDWEEGIDADESKKEKGLKGENIENVEGIDCTSDEGVSRGEGMVNSGMVNVVNGEKSEEISKVDEIDHIIEAGVRNAADENNGEEKVNLGIVNVVNVEKSEEMGGLEEIGRGRGEGVGKAADESSGEVAKLVNTLGIDYDMEEGEIIEEEEGEVLEDRWRVNSHTGSLDRGVDNSRNDSVGEEDSYGRKQSNKDNGKIGDEATKRSRSDHLGNAVSAENGSSLMERGKSNAHYYKERDLDYQSRYLYPEDGQRHKKSVTRSPYYKHRSRSCSRSPSQTRGRSRSQSVIRESSLRLTPHRKSDKFYERDNGSDTDDEGICLDNKTHRAGSREILREKERERSSSVHTRRSERHHIRDSRERYRAGSQDIDRERIKEKEVNREREKVREKEAQRERHKDRETEREKHKRRDREIERERDRQRDRERERRQRDSERSSGRSRDIDLDRVSDKGSRHLKDNYDERGKYDQSRHRRYDESDHKDKHNKSDRDISSPPVKDNDNLKRFEDGQEEYEERIVLQLAEQEEDDLDRIKEESRRRKLAILEKYRSQHSQQQEASHPEVTAAKDREESPSQSVTTQIGVSEMPDAHTEGPDIFATQPSFAIAKSPPQNGLPVPERVAGTGGLGEGTPKSERSPDVICDDIFGESPAGVCKTGKGDGKAIIRSGLDDNWDDAEGYYSYRFGELLDGRYEIVAAHGKGVFSTVVRAKDLKAKLGDPEEVAIKMIRSNETMYKAGMEELVILKKLVGADPEDRRHCVRFISSFKYRNHLCLVFESLHMNLREVLKKFGRNIGLKLTAVRVYAKQLFIALKHLRNCGVLHCDIKPDNMLVNEAKNVLKLCDFGNAMFAGKNEVTPYLVSRFYRAPEIILGLPYDHPLDMWSVGCCLFELYTGKVLFPGATNNDMLRLHMELKGPFPKKMMRKGLFIDQHFDHDLNFLATEEDPVNKKAIKRLMLNIKPKDVGSLILGSAGEDAKMLANFKDLMEKIFLLDPDKRLTVSQALNHPFITGK
ncbi:protein modifying enzyme [Lithospermum erythrorhizon]|uniref:non-specific serine/threonine protein kinase n=1 Tax=Lithospermum erythrorhizon TaxID=34254 RepID=A0AAV3PW43_LITER